MQEDHNPYEAPRVPLASANEFAAILSEEEVATFSNETSEHRVGYYAGRFQKSLDGGSLGFNGAAFMFGSNWCFWRKLFRVGALLLLLEIVSAFGAVLALLLIFDFEDAESPALTMVPFVVLFGFIRVPFGLWANRLYLRMAAREAAKARSQAGGPDEVMSLLARRGGTSGLGLAAGLAISAVIRLLDGFAA